MLKVLIVDDEVLVKIGLRNVIPWREHGFEIVGEACNGQQALEIARREFPDIVLTDIRMPVMDGIQLIEALRVEMPDTKIIILSAYKDFDYVQHAMRLGVKEYVLKLSMEPEDFLLVLNRVRRQIEMERSNPGFSPALHQIEQRSICMRASGRFPDFPLPDMPARMVLFLFPMQDKLDVPGSPPQTALALEHIFGNDAGAFYLDDRRYGLLAPDSNAFSPAALNALKKRLESRFAFPISIGVSRLVSGADRFPDALSEATRAARHSFYTGFGSLCRAENLPEYLPVARHSKWQAAEKAIITHHLDEACRFILALLADPPERYISPDSAINVCIMLMRAITISMQEESAEADTAPPKQYNTVEELAAQVRQAAQRFDRHEEMRYSADILTIVRYVRDNYTKPIRLSDVAELVYRNESYVSHLFRQKMNIKFVDYVTQVRVEKAKALLVQENLPISTIAEQVGFSDPAYFCRVFKKTTQQSPQAYRHARH